MEIKAKQNLRAEVKVKDLHSPANTRVMIATNDAMYATHCLRLMKSSRNVMNNDAHTMRIDVRYPKTSGNIFNVSYNKIHLNQHFYQLPCIQTFAAANNNTECVIPTTACTTINIDKQLLCSLCVYVT